MNEHPEQVIRDREPEISIGLPVYNGARFLEQALQSLLQQSYRDLELIISDNASSDSTPEICAHYSTRDARIRYVRQRKNIGAPRNWSLVATLARGRFFKWASVNDLVSPDMLEKCVAVLRARPDAVLAYGRTCLMDEESGAKALYAGDFALDDLRPSDRFEHLLRSLELNNAQSGLIKVSALRETGLDRPYAGGDVPLMAELALRGTFVLIPDVLLFRRMGPRTFSRGLEGCKAEEFYGSRSSNVVRVVRRTIDYSSSVLTARIEVREKFRALRCLARHAWWDAVGLLRSSNGSAGP